MTHSWCVILGLIAGGMATEAVAAEQIQQSAVNQASRVVTAESLRAAGPAGLDRALQSYDQLRQEQNRLSAEADRIGRTDIDGKKEPLLAIERRIEELQSRIDSVQKTIDQIGGQRGCSVSRLYWYTDINEAKAASAREGRPILSLRMLGKLTDEYSCANSRFFRTALYSNKKISDYLRDNFVLHWQSVRPVPKVTIDFGDGRKLERTLTGNSAHYVLASDGTPLDALPGLYGPQPFLNWLGEMQTLNGYYQQAAIGKNGSDAIAARTEAIKAFHANQLTLLLDAWDRDLQKLGEPRTRLVAARIDAAVQSAALTNTATNDEAAKSQQAPSAVKAAPRAVSKTGGEAPIMRFANLGGTWIERGMDDELWQAVADLHRENTKLDDASVAVMGREFPRAALAGRLAITKSFQENPVLRLVRAFESSMTLDTVRNEYLLHRRIHELYAEELKPALVTNVDQFNEWVYSELFLTPSRDPWLGLAPNDVYTALEQDGRTEAAAPVANHPGG
jgi:hypothetical protein